MSAVTSLILVGSSNPHNGGNRDFAQVTLEEGDRPALILRWTQQKRPREERFRRFTMIPTLENLLDDAVLLIAYAVCRVPSIVELVERLDTGAAMQSGRVHMHKDFASDDRFALYAAVQQLKDFPKVTFCLFSGTHIEHSISHLDNYLLECEVTRSVYERRRPAFTDLS